MSYFEGLKLTKKGEQLQAKINGNLSETLTFTKAKLGSGSITSNDEIRFLTDVKEVWGTANVTSCKIQGDEKNIVAIELQFSNAELREDKIFREIGLYAQGNEGEEILYAYANAGDKYDYIPLMKDSPHAFIIVIYFNITSGSKVDAKIDLHSYVSLQEFNEGMNKKVNKTDYASAEQYGIVKYGTEEGTVLEGNKFTQMMGKDYGGILNEPGLKTSGKAYWDNNTRKLYICKNNNSDISPNINNYIPFDNGSILERLENLVKSKVLKIPASEMRNIMTFKTSGGDYVLYEKGISNFKQKAGIPKNSTIVSIMSMQSYGYLEHITYDEDTDTVYVGFLIYSTIQDRVASILVKYII